METAIADSEKKTLLGVSEGLSSVETQSRWDAVFEEEVSFRRT